MVVRSIAIFRTKKGLRCSGGDGFGFLLALDCIPSSPKAKLFLCTQFLFKKGVRILCEKLFHIFQVGKFFAFKQSWTNTKAISRRIWFKEGQPSRCSWTRKEKKGPLKLHSGGRRIIHSKPLFVFVFFSNSLRIYICT